VVLIRPDWTKAAAYRDLARASLRRIAWEFLRRNPEYQKDWQRYANAMRGLVAGDATLEPYVEHLLAPDPPVAHDAATGAERERLWSLLVALPGYRIQDEQAPSGSRRIEMHYGRKWGLSGIRHPMDSRHSRFRFTTDARSNWSVHVATGAGVQSLEEKQGGLHGGKWVVLAIDLSYPIKVIESNVLDLLKAERALRIATGDFEPITSRALANSKYIEYLQILDGTAEGKTASEIGAVLAPNAANDPPLRQRDKRFRSALKEAQRLQADGYLELPRLQK
jgi:hypothetical protein